MSSDPTSPPDAISLQRLLAEKEAMLAERGRLLAQAEAELARTTALVDDQQRIIALRDAELYAKTLQIEHLKARLALLRRQRYGRSSEKLDQEIDLLEMMLGELEEGVAESTARAEQANKQSAKPQARRKFTPHGRKPLPEHLPRERVVLNPPQPDCPSCGGTVLRKVGEAVTEVLEYVPSSFKVIEYVRPVVSCRACETMLQAPPPSLPIERGRPGPALLAHVAVSKYVDALPLHRQAAMYEREGVDLDRSTLADWIGSMAALTEPLVRAIADHVQAGPVVHADDTPVPVLSPGRGRTKTGRLWVALRDERPWAGPAPPAAFYRYSPDRRGEHAEALLGSCRGFLQADAYAGFNTLYAPEATSGEPRLREVACWSHARRKIFDVLDATGSPLAKEAIERIRELFAIEAAVNGRPPADRLAARQTEAVPKLTELKTFLTKAHDDISGKTTLARAIRYATSRWEALTRYTTDGRLDISNNAAERAIRPLALGRKNYLFAGSDSGGVRAAAMYTLVQSARLNDLNPEPYLRDVFARIADHPINQIKALLPWN
jgi:transposase